jgi:hypothetical protein
VKVLPKWYPRGAPAHTWAYRFRTFTELLIRLQRFGKKIYNVIALNKLNDLKWYKSKTAKICLYPFQEVCYIVIYCLRIALHLWFHW